MNELRKAREAANMTLEELADAVGSSKNYMWQLENKVDPQPYVRMGYQLARHLGVPIEQLFDVGPTEELNDDKQTDEMVCGDEGLPR